MKKPKDKYTNLSTFFVLASVLLWASTILVSFSVLKSGGHLAPRAAEFGANFIKGQVLDSKGRAIGGAKVTVTRGGVNNYIYADSVGGFMLDNMQRGEYSVLGEAQGYRPQNASVILDGISVSLMLTLHE